MNVGNGPRWSASSAALGLLFAVYFFRFQEQVAPLADVPLTKLVGGVLLLAVAVECVRRRRWPVVSPAAVWLAALVAWGFLTAPFAVDRWLALTTGVEMSKALLVLVLCRNAMLGRRPLNHAVAVLCACAAALACIGIGQYLGWLPVDGWPRIRVLSGPHADPNDLASLLCACLPFALGASVAGARRWSRAAGIAAATILLAGLAASQSRTGFVGLLTVGVLFLWRHRRAGLVWLACAVAIFLGLPRIAERTAGKPPIFRPVYYEAGKPVVDRGDPGVRHRVLQAFDMKEKSVQGRLEIWRIGLGLAADDPLTGVGAGCFRAAYEPVATERGLPEDLRARTAHSVYVRAAAEYGLPGLLLVLALLGAPLARLRSASSSDWLVHAAALSLISTIVTLAFVDQLGVWGVFFRLAIAESVADHRGTS